jgi:hypothetical protein
MAPSELIVGLGGLKKPLGEGVVWLKNILKSRLATGESQFQKCGARTASPQEGSKRSTV